MKFFKSKPIKIIFLYAGRPFELTFKDEHEYNEWLKAI